jgi:uncharacterized protein YdeI (YjbR/CyaY-like superfamily)
MEILQDLPVIFFKDSLAWSDWLADNHAQTSGLWLKIAKKATGIASVDYAQALDEALCYGWIDGQKRSYDEEYFLQKFTPRRPRSVWSKVNVAKVEVLINQGRMRAAGQKAIDQAKADGRWDAAYESSKNAKVPKDLEDALRVNDLASARFVALNKAERYSILFGLMTAKMPKTRASRLKKALEKLSEPESL